MTQVVGGAEVAPSCWRQGTCAGLIVGLAFATAICGCTESVRAPAHSKTGGAQISAAALAGAGSGGQLSVGGSGGQLSVGKELDASQPTSNPESQSAIEEQSGAVSAVGARDCSSEDATKLLTSKAGYRPAGERYPQIIQGQDYAPVEAVRALYIEASGTTKLGEFGFEDHREGKVEASKIVITGARKVVDVELGSRIRIGQRAFSDAGTILLFRTFDYSPTLAHNADSKESAAVAWEPARIGTTFGSNSATGLSC